MSVAVLLGCASTDSGADESAVEFEIDDPEAASSAGPEVIAPPNASGEFWRSTEVVDGDTLYVSGPRGDVEVRIIGVNTPETGECFGEEASEALSNLVAGEELVLVTDRSDVDQFGRALRYVETAEGLDVGAELVANGFAIARRYPPDDARADAYAELQNIAQDGGRGLWASDACGRSDLDADIEIEVNPDAPGDDGKNLNGEWVRFVNRGAETLDLDGWEVADESASHRYTFANIRLASGDGVTLFSGCGEDDATVRYWCASRSAVWNNSGDTVFLRDGNGNIVTSLSYGESG